MDGIAKLLTALSLASSQIHLVWLKSTGVTLYKITLFLDMPVIASFQLNPHMG